MTARTARSVPESSRTEISFASGSTVIVMVSFRPMVSLSANARDIFTPAGLPQVREPWALISGMARLHRNLPVDPPHRTGNNKESIPREEEAALKTSNRTIIGLGIFLFLVAAALFLLLSGLDRIVAAAIEKYGSEATGTKVGVSSVKIALKGGTGSIRNLSVGNPPGFSEPDAFRLEDISVAMDPGAVTGNPVVIDQVTILSSPIPS